MSGLVSSRGRTVRRLILSTALAVISFSSFSPARAAEDVNITMSYFRYCLGEVCTPDQFAYVRLAPPAPRGPTLPPAADNPRGAIEARPGDRIVWTYNDPLCDFNDGAGGGPSPIDCPGHNVLFEDGSVTSPLMLARTDPPETFSWKVPRTTAPGTVIRYYCEPLPGNAHYQIGMTGILRIV